MPIAGEVLHLQHSKYSYLETRFDAEISTCWAQMKPKGKPCFTPQLLLELRAFICWLIRTSGKCSIGGNMSQIQYAVLSSKVPGIFNLGGDLSLFKSAIHHRDRRQLEQYARMCVEDLFDWNRNFGLSITTISLVQGNALGGGFEAALASSVIVAEESARFGFPEVLFNLFPGMGAYSFLTRKVGRRVTEEMIVSGNTYTARQLYDKGVVDVVVPDGTGEAAVVGYIKQHARAGNGRRAFERVRRDFESVSREELEHITEIWVDTALQLSERDIRMMDRLVRAQERAGLGTGRDGVLAQPSANNSYGRAAVAGAD